MSALPPPQPSRGRIVPAPDARRWLDAARALAEAQAEAEAIRTAARAEADRLRAEATEQGRRAGAAEAARLVADTCRRLDTYLAGLEPALADLALELVRKLLGSAERSELLAGLVREALAAQRRDVALTLRVAPADAERLRAALSAALPGDNPLLTIEPDAALHPGEGMLESRFGFVPVGLEAQLAVLRAAALPGRDGEEP